MLAEHCSGTYRGTTSTLLLISVPQLFVGLVVSCAMFVITLTLSVYSRGPESVNGLKSAGILQLTWLLGNDEHLAKVGRPKRQALRKAGLFDVQISDLAHRKASAAGVDDDEDSELTKLNAYDHI